MNAEQVLVKRWRGGTHASRGFTAVGAKIELARMKKVDSGYEWEVAAHPHEPGRFELRAYEKGRVQSA